jgi:hypothetical protein
MQSDAFAQARTSGLLRCWGRVMGTGCGSAERWTYAAEATKKAICWPFLKPSDGLEPSTPSASRARFRPTAVPTRILHGKCHRNELLRVQAGR